MQLGLGLGLSRIAGFNAPPTDISLSGSTVAEDADLGEIVGELSAIDIGDEVTFSLIDDSGGLFDVSGSDLIVSGVLDYETDTSHLVTVRATDSGGGTYDESFIITVTDVSETPSEDPPPDGDPVDDGTFTSPPVVTEVDGGVKIHGKKSAGSTGKFIYDIGPLNPGYKYTMKYDPDFSLLAQQGKLAMVGFGLKDGQDFRLVGLKGDGSTGLHKYVVNGSSPNGWSASTGHTTSDGGAAANGTQAGPNWVQLQIANDGSTYTFRTSGDGVTWSDEYTNVTPTPFTNTTDATSAGIAVYIDGSDAGNFSVLITLWTAGASFRGTIVNNAGDSGSTSFVDTDVAWDTETIDIDGVHAASSTEFVVPAVINGRYGIFHGQVELTSVTPGSFGYIYISKGGSDGVFDGYGMTSHTLNQTAPVFGWMNCQSQPVLLTTGEIYELVLNCNDSSTVLQGENSHFSLELVG